MHKEVTTIAGKGCFSLFRRAAITALLLACAPLTAEDSGSKGRASVRDTEETIVEPKRAFEAVLLAQARTPRVEALPDVPPTIIINEAPSGVTPVPVGSELPPSAPLYLDTPPSEQPFQQSTEWKREILPDSLLWQPPLANPLQPRFYLKSTNLTKFYTEETIDTGIGAMLPMIRWTAPNPRDLAWQFDFLAFHMSRWTKRDKPVGQDYRYGAVVSGATGNWSWKIAYEHTSCHAGDELIKDMPEINRDSHIREELVLGLAYTFWEQLRVYAIGAYAFSSAFPSNEYLDKTRYGFGIEWVSPVNYLRVIQPYGALDVEYRGDQRYIANITVQTGIRIQAPAHKAAVRFGLEYYRGNSPFGQFFDNREEWAGIFAAFDY